MPALVRSATPGEAVVMQQIERSAGQRFLELDMRRVANDDAVPLATLAEYILDGRAFVAVDASNRPVGFTLVRVVDDHAHIAELSVELEQQGRGFGRALVDAVTEWAHRNGLQAVSLTTFVHVPWNRPLYEHLGFEVVDARGIGLELQEVLRHEADIGLDPELRVAMRRPVV